MAHSEWVSVMSWSCCDSGWSYGGAAERRSTAQAGSCEQDTCRLQHWLLGLQLTHWLYIIIIIVTVNTMVSVILWTCRRWIWMCRVRAAVSQRCRWLAKWSQLLFVLSYYFITSLAVYISVACHQPVQSCWPLLVFSCMHTHTATHFVAQHPFSTYLAPSRICLLLLCISKIYF